MAKQKRKKTRSSITAAKKDKNQHGLSRYIPPAIKMAVRRNSGFGCVVCGQAITQYEHVDPEWKDATVHDPAKITALCGTHHDQVTRKRMAKDTVKRWMANPITKATRYSKTQLDLWTENLTFVLCSNTYTNTTSPIGIAGQPVFIIEPPKDSASEFHLSATFYDAAGNETLKITKNECHFSADNWDVEIVGGRCTIKDQQGDICLQLLVEPPHKIIIDEICMDINGWPFMGDSGKLDIFDPQGTKCVSMSGERCTGGTDPYDFCHHFG